MYFADDQDAGGDLLGVTKELVQQLPALQFVEFQTRQWLNGGDCWSDEAGPSGGQKKLLSVMFLPSIFDSEITVHAFALVQRPASDRLFPQVVINTFLSHYCAYICVWLNMHGYVWLWACMHRFHHIL
jgi:hypothetical protein